MARLHPEDGAMRLLLGADEVEVLVSLSDGLSGRIADAMQRGSSDPIIDRLTPTVSRGDSDLDAELRGMLRGELLSDRVARLQAFTDELRDAQASADAGIDRRLDRNAAMRVVEALNDLRLALATTIGLADDLRMDPGVDDEHQAALRLVDALAWLQGALIDFIDRDD